MLPSMPSFSSPATVRVEKATSDLLILPDWTMNMEICDSINSNHWDAKDVIKALKKRLQHKNPKVQILSLTLLETLVKNCGDYMHFQIADRNVLQEMIKIVKKKSDPHVREKILVLLDSWQEAFGGPGGKYPQYFWAYEDLRRSGVVFPQRSLDAAPIFTPPVAQSNLRHTQASYGMPLNSSTRLDEAMASDIEHLSLSSINSMRDVLDLLADMLEAANPTDCMSVKDEVIVDLVNRCRSNQKKLMQMLTTTLDEGLLGQGLELNDTMQIVLAKHDAIASGSPLPNQRPNLKHQFVAVSGSTSKPAGVKEPEQTKNASPSKIAASIKSQIEDDEDVDDGFAQLARRHSKTQSTTSQDSSLSFSGNVIGNTANITVPSVVATTVPFPSKALTLPDTPAPLRTTKEQDLIDLLSITLYTATSSQTPCASATSSQDVHHEHHCASQVCPISEGQLSFNSYVAPWAQQPQTQTQTQTQTQPQPQPYPNAQLQPQSQPQYPEHSYGYIPPPWAPTPGYFSNQNNISTTSYMLSTPQANTLASFTTFQGDIPLQPDGMFHSRESNGLSINGEPMLVSNPRSTTTPGQKAFVPSYRLFEDLKALGNGGGMFKMTSSKSPSLSGTASQGMVGGSNPI
ncbi:hypothetical protein NMG60_11000096 [Bertholletia excelsa]